MLRLISHSPAETRALGRRLGTVAQAGDVFLLDGGFGAGKTHLVQGLAEGLGVDGPVTSPSFILAQEYHGRLPLYHLDLFRLEGLDTATWASLEDYLGGDGVCAVEWPAALPPAASAGATRIALDVVDDTTRAITVEAARPPLAEAVADAARA